ncbi:hypothetical protein OAG89_02475 [Pseudomonadales bacterium]|nr:hypothetical protein [Pseudomonadales bacterium]
MFNLLLAIVLLPSFAAADESINILGTWQGVTNAAVMGVDKHYTTIHAEEIRFVNVKMELVFDRQEGQNFSGYNLTNNHKEPVIGAFRSNMKSGVLVDSNGTTIFDMVGNNKMDVCYAHVMSHGEASAVASCAEFERQSMQPED